MSFSNTFKPLDVPVILTWNDLCNADLVIKDILLLPQFSNTKFIDHEMLQIHEDVFVWNNAVGWQALDSICFHIILRTCVLCGQIIDLLIDQLPSSHYSSEHRWYFVLDKFKSAIILRR